MKKCYQGISNPSPTTENPCENPLSTDCIQSPEANPIFDLPEGFTQTEMNAAITSAITYKQQQIEEIQAIDNKTYIEAGTDILITGEGVESNPYIINDSSPFQKTDEGNGNGIIVKGRISSNYGNVGLNAIDLSFSDSVSSVYGATGESSFATGEINIASGYGSTAMGVDTVASNSFSFAFGYQTRATGYNSTAQGSDTEASGSVAYAEGENTTASGDDSHAQNLNTTAEGNASHAEGEQTTASGQAAHSEGFQTQAIGNYSHAGGNNNIANSFSETAIGLFGTAPSGNATTWIGTDRVFNVGNGTTPLLTSDALSVFKNGLATLPSVTNSLITSASDKALITKEWAQSQGYGGISAGYTVSTLPVGIIGMRAYVTDATATTFYSVVVGGGVNTVPVFYNGVSWLVG